MHSELIVLEVVNNPYILFEENPIDNTNAEVIIDSNKVVFISSIFSSFVV